MGHSALLHQLWWHDDADDDDDDASDASHASADEDQ